MRKLVVTDGYTLNPGDLDWQPFEKFGDLSIYDRTPTRLIAERCQDASIIITNKTPLDAPTIRSCHGLEMIAVTATGFNIVDLEAAREKGIYVCNVPDYGTDSVAQHTIALILELTNHAGTNSERVRMGEWSTSDDWCFTRAPIIELKNKTLGIVGYGRIGQKVAEIASAFGMQVIYYNRSKKEGVGKSVSVREVFSGGDFVSLHLPLLFDNYGFINGELISLMKPSAFLINTSRGQLVNENDLAFALRSKKISGAALDVLSVEPPPADHPLTSLDNCIITPHNAWLSFEARKRILDTTFRNIELVLKKEPQNVVSLQK